jgi:tetratricopeptide (TPR) repeat protein
VIELKPDVKRATSTACAAAASIQAMADPRASARKPFLQGSNRDPTKTWVEELFEDKKLAKIEALCEQALKKDPACTPALIWQARLARQRNDLDTAIERLTLAVAGDRQSGEAHYELAATHARKGNKAEMLAQLGAAIRCNNLYASVADAPAFAAFQHDPDLGALTDALPSDPVLRPLFEKLSRGRFYDVYREGLRLLDEGHPPRVAIVDAVEHALEMISSDLQEHGDDNLELYGGDAHDVAFFESEYARIQALAATVRTSGEKSDEFARFRAQRL